MHRIALACLGILLAVPADALAATARIEQPATGGTFASNAVLVVRGEPGEVNDLQVTVDFGRSITVRDRAAPLNGGCEQVDSQAIRCPWNTAIELVGGDGDDRLEGGDIADGGPGNDTVVGAGLGRGGDGDDTIAGTRNADGGAGADSLTATEGAGTARLAGGPGDDTLTGQAGNDTLEPGPGRDAVAAGPGDDVVLDEDPEPGADRFDGGGGADRLDFGTRTAGGRIDLAAQASSDGDAIAGFERARGGFGDDTLAGDDGANQLSGGPGRDRLAGAGGDDVLEGGAGFDVFDAGPGDDRIDASSSFELGLPDGFEPVDAGSEPISCGPGRDTVGAVAGDLVRRDCERLPYGLRPRPLERGARGLAFVIPCRRAVRGVGGRCRGTVIAVGGRRARGRFDLRIGRSKRVRLRGGDVRGRGPLAITVRYRRGDDVTVRWMIPGGR